MFGSITTPRSTRSAHRTKTPNLRFSGVAAGPAEKATASTTSSTYLGEVGAPVDVVARVAGTTPPRPGDTSDIVRHCFRTVDDGLALCCPLPDTEHLRLGSVVRVRGSITDQRTQGSNLVTEINAEQVEPIG